MGRRARKKYGRADKRRRRPLRPKDVFTPNGFPLERDQVYAARAEAEKALQQGLDRQRVPLVYGEYGVGKTTLVKRFFLPQNQRGQFVHFLTPAKKTIEDLTRVILERLDYRVEVNQQAASLVAVEVEASTNYFTPVTAKFRGKGESSKSRTTELVIRTPTEQGLLELMADYRLIIAIDEMHKADDAFKAEIVEIIKAINNQGLQYPKIVLLGTTSTPSELVSLDQGVDRLVKETKVQPMSVDEAEFVIRDGMRRLGIEIEDRQVVQLRDTAVGSFGLVHELCLDAADRVLNDERSTVDDGDIANAVRVFLLENQARLTAKYMKAIEHTGPRRYRKQILQALAESPNEYVNMDELVLRVSEQVGEPVPASSLSGPLRSLKDDETYGKLIADVPAHAGRLHNVTTFRDVGMKAFIRAFVTVERRGYQLTEDEIDALPEPDDDD